MNNALILRDVGHLARDTRLVFELLDNVHGGMLEIRLPDGARRLFGDGEHGVTLQVHDESMFGQVLARGDIGLAEAAIGAGLLVVATLVTRYVVGLPTAEPISAPDDPLG